VAQFETSRFHGRRLRVGNESEHRIAARLDRHALGAVRRWPRRGLDAAAGTTVVTAAVIEPAAPAIELDRLCVRHGAAPVLEDITLTVRPDEIFGLLGVQGAGKTSLLRSILLLATPCAGTVHLFGEPRDEASARSRLAYLPERFQPPGHLSGRDFVKLTLAFYGCAAKRARIAARAEQLELDPHMLERPIRDYRKGMVQKLALLALFLTDLPLLVLDEPMSGLDPKARALVKRQLVAERARGRTILLSAPIPADHDGLCDRIAILHQGRLSYVGTPGELRARTGAPTLASAFLAVTRGAARA
jgi:ABC-2 type transport system ATP-binding protein